MRVFCVLVVIAVAAGACQRRKADSEHGLGSATAWTASMDAAKPADASPCVEECVKRSQMRATDPEAIVAECMVECGVAVTGGLAEMPDLTLRVPPEALQDLPRCARLAAVLNQIVQCPDVRVELRHQMKGVLEVLVEQLRSDAVADDAEVRRQVEQQCRMMAIMFVEWTRPTGCKVELGGPP